jgi:hypothetical protein
MKTMTKIALLAVAPFALAACDSAREDQAEAQGDVVEQNAEVQADAMENQADVIRDADAGINSAGNEAAADRLEDRADATRGRADATADRMENNAERDAATGATTPQTKQ